MTIKQRSYLLERKQKISLTLFKINKNIKIYYIYNKQNTIPKKKKKGEKRTNMNIVGVEDGVDNPIQIEVEIIKLYAIRVWQGGVDEVSFIFSSFNDNVRVLVYQPPIERRHTHVSSLSLRE